MVYQLYHHNKYTITKICKCSLSQKQSMCFIKYVHFTVFSQPILEGKQVFLIQIKQHLTHYVLCN